jgi:hypothetical protein
MKNRSFGSGYVRMHWHRQAAPTLVIGEHENNVRTLHPGTCGWQVDSQEKRNDLGERMSHRLVANIAVVQLQRIPRRRGTVSNNVRMLPIYQGGLPLPGAPIGFFPGKGMDLRA